MYCLNRAISCGGIWVYCLDHAISYVILREALGVLLGLNVILWGSHPISYKNQPIDVSRIWQGIWYYPNKRSYMNPGSELWKNPIWDSCKILHSILVRSSMIHVFLLGVSITAQIYCRPRPNDLLKSTYDIKCDVYNKDASVPLAN